MMRKSVFSWISNRVNTVLTITMCTVFLAVLTVSSIMGANNRTPNFKYENRYDTLIVNHDTIIFEYMSGTDAGRQFLDSVANELKRTHIEDSLEKTKTDLILLVDDYIKSVAPKSRMTGKNIVELCLEYDFDITLLLAQGHLETHFATCGSNNCFGVSGRRGRHSHPDDSVIEYINLMKKSYVKNRTSEQALAANLNVEGSRKAFYSELSTYGRTVSGIRNNIIRKTDIMPLFHTVQELNDML